MGSAKVPGSAREAELERMMRTHGNQLVGLCTGLLRDPMLAQDSVGVGDGVSIADGSPKGIPTMILDSAEEWISDTTLQGFQEVGLPEDYEVGERIVLLMSVLYSTTVYYQDNTGVYRTGIRQSGNRGILHIPFSVTVGGSAAEKTGTLSTGDYAAHASLTFTDVTAYGEVAFDAGAWSSAYQAGSD